MLGHNLLMHEGSAMEFGVLLSTFSLLDVALGTLRSIEEM